MNILAEITADTNLELERLKKEKPINILEKSKLFSRNTNSLKRHLINSEVGIIAEIKRCSPSNGIIKSDVQLDTLADGYIKSGASGLSVLTNEKYFHGSPEDISAIRHSSEVPILRKDFILDEYQIVESKSIGADCILLIASCLTVEKCRSLARLAKSLNLEVLLEIHTLAELNMYINIDVDMVGVNNRNLDDLSTSIETSLSLVDSIPDSFLKISESGIDSAASIINLMNNGFDAFLIGTYFMTNEDPARACKNLLDRTKEQLR